MKCPKCGSELTSWHEVNLRICSQCGESFEWPEDSLPPMSNDYK